MVAEDIDKYAALAGFASSEAGQIMLATLTDEAASTIVSLVAGYKTLPDLELRALCAQLDARLQFLRTLKRSRTNLEDAEEVLSSLTT